MKTNKTIQKSTDKMLPTMMMVMMITTLMMNAGVNNYRKEQKTN